MPKGCSGNFENTLWKCIKGGRDTLPNTNLKIIIITNTMGLSQPPPHIEYLNLDPKRQTYMLACNIENQMLE